MSIRTLGTATDVRPCVHCKPGHIALAASPEASDNWAAEVSCAAFAAGSVLYARGSTSRHIFGICDGLVKLVVPAANGDQRIVRLASEGDVIGLEGLADNAYHSSASAITSVRSYVIPVPRIKGWDIANTRSMAVPPANEADILEHGRSPGLWPIEIRVSRSPRSTSA